MDELQLPLDAEGFSRRECPRCHAEFKLRWSAREPAVLACAMARRVTMNSGELEPQPARVCPYCASSAAADRFLTPEIQRHLDGEARQLDEEVRRRRVRLPPEWLSENPRVSSKDPALTARPREPLRRDPDGELCRIDLPCCGVEQKVSGAWVGPIRCHLCGIAHLRAGPRDIGLELALLKEWAEEQ
jgi:hypothetical protein